MRNCLNSLRSGKLHRLELYTIDYASNYHCYTLKLLYAISVEHFLKINLMINCCPEGVLLNACVCSIRISERDLLGVLSQVGPSNY